MMTQAEVSEMRRRMLQARDVEVAALLDELVEVRRVLAALVHFDGQRYTASNEAIDEAIAYLSTLPKEAERAKK